MAVTAGVVSKVPGLESVLKPLEEKKPDFIEVKSYQWKIVFKMQKGKGDAFSMDVEEVNESIKKATSKGWLVLT